MKRGGFIGELRSRSSSAASRWRLPSWRERKVAMHKAIALACIAISATLAGLYGYISADTVFYGVIRAASLCAVAVVGACCPAWASHHWQERRYGQCVITWLVCAVCLAVTLGGGIGTIAGGAERSTAERAKASSAAKNDDAELARTTNELAK